jgi:hypothetical protein
MDKAAFTIQLNDRGLRRALASGRVSRRALERMSRVAQLCRYDQTSRTCTRSRMGPSLEGHHREPARGSWDAAERPGGGKTQVTRQARASCGIDISGPSSGCPGPIRGCAVGGDLRRSATGLLPGCLNRGCRREPDRHIRIVASLDRNRLAQSARGRLEDGRGGFDKETRRKAQAFSAEAVWECPSLFHRGLFDLSTSEVTSHGRREDIRRESTQVPA